MPIAARVPHRPRRRRRLKSMRMVPSLFTLASLLCGFAAIYFSQRAMFPLDGGDPAPMTNLRLMHRLFPSILSFAAGLVILGMFLDMFDGLVARATRHTTDFGGQLDSLADMVNCGVAPAALMIAFMLQYFKGDAVAPSPISDTFFGRVAWACACVYVVFTAVRLARYNVEHAKADFDYRTFRGLPSPGAAGMMCALILFHDQVHDIFRPYFVYVMPVVALTTGLLMVSRIPYRRFQGYIQGRKPFHQLVIIVLLGAVFWSYKAPTLFAIILFYVLSGPAGYAYRTVREVLRHRRVEKQAADAGASAEVGIASAQAKRKPA